VRDVHSIYFEVLGEHGWVGLILFLSILGFTWLKCGAIVRRAKGKAELSWARDLAAMIQVTLVAYMSAGAFLGLAYFDYVYHLVAIVVVVHVLVRQPQPSTPISLGYALSTLRGKPASGKPAVHPA
jgi:O-antigen ligase